MGNVTLPCTSLELAAVSGLVIVRTEGDGVVRLEDPLLWIGPGADDNLIATIACRRSLKQEGVIDEDEVRELVELEGFAYRLEPALHEDDEGDDPVVARTQGRRRRSAIPVG